MTTKPPTVHLARVFLHKPLYAVAKCACGYMARFYYTGGCKVITQGQLMKNTTKNVARFFAQYFDIDPTPETIRRAIELNHETLDCMVKYAEQVRAFDVARYRSAIQKVLRYYRGEDEYNFLHITDEQERDNARHDAWMEIVSELENLTQ